MDLMYYIYAGVAAGLLLPVGWRMFRQALRVGASHFEEDEEIARRHGL